MYDIAINNAMLLLPDAIVTVRGSIGIEDGIIACIADGFIKAHDIIDAAGLVASPGFIDPHGHLEGYGHGGRLSLLQGVTTSLGGNCGGGPVDIEAFFTSQAGGYAVHQAEMSGHSMMRRSLGIPDDKAADTEQIRQMVEMAEMALYHGACGLSFGLGYAPGASNEEAYALFQVAKTFGRPVSVDTRMTSPNDLQGLGDVIGMANAVGCRLVLSHFVYQYGLEGLLMDEALAIVDGAIAAGMDIYIDSGMYTWWTSPIGTALFNEAFMLSGVVDLNNFIMATGEHRGERLNHDTYLHMRQNHARDSVVEVCGEEAEIIKNLLKPYCMPSSDTGRYLPGEGHPQIAGTFPRYFDKMHRGDHLSLAEAVYRATALPARVFSLRGKGLLKEGADADIVLFNPETIRDTAWFLGDGGVPDAPPVGIEHVIVAGKRAAEHGTVLDDHAGRPIIF